MRLHQPAGWGAAQAVTAGLLWLWPGKQSNNKKYIFCRDCIVYVQHTTCNWIICLKSWGSCCIYFYFLVIKFGAIFSHWACQPQSWCLKHTFPLIFCWLMGNFLAALSLLNMKYFLLIGIFLNIPLHSLEYH